MNAPSFREQQETIASWLQTGSINIFGLPFAGKDTQAQRLAEIFDAPIIGGGDILRSQPTTPQHVLEIIGTGRLAPIKEFLLIMTSYIRRPEFAGRPLILSSVGRRHGEEEGIMQVLESTNHPLKTAVLIGIDEYTVRKRWQTSENLTARGLRDDDAAEALDIRFQEFQDKTTPVIDYYRSLGLLLEIDGKLPPNRVTAEILAGLVGLAGKAT
jgi:adenylate kinase